MKLKHGTEHSHMLPKELISMTVVARAYTLFVLLATLLPTALAMDEAERLEGYHSRNYTWPMPHDRYIPNTPGWRNLMEERLAQIQEMPKSKDRYEAYHSVVYSAFLAPNFTELGFGLGRAPDELMEALRKGIRDGVATAGEEEGTHEEIPGPHAPWFIDRPDLRERVLDELQAYPEAWAGMELVPYVAYGFRLYRNQSALNMHLDIPETHVVSMILHIDSSDDAEPWPIFIEDFQGRTHEVLLTSGDILFYESSKCFHGRPKLFKGTWYSSIFVHYYPKDWEYFYNDKEAHYAIPLHWRKQLRKPRQHYALKMAGTSMFHPECPDDWCLTYNSIKWSGPGETGYWIAPDFTKHHLDLDTAPSMQAR